MYTEQHYQMNRKQLRQRSVLLGIPAFILLAIVIASFILRIKWLTMLSTILLGSFSLFCYYLLLYPVIAYGRHMHELLFGRTRTMTGAFKEMGRDLVLREGVKFYPVIISVGRMEHPDDDRLLYYDANLPLPEWQQGEWINFTVHDKSIGKWEFVRQP
ncbi:MAG: hypothetical protein IKT57_00960 [Clostridia bacterium]|nr:hypothetical protein [Clostridia bacterium]